MTAHDLRFSGYTGQDLEVELKSSAAATYRRS
jgi:hypothetical protein